MALLDLAPELLDEIIGYCMPEGFESFALSCKGSYAYCKPRIPLHNRLSRLWKQTANKFPMQRDAFRILLEIAKEPLVARYIQHLDLLHRLDSTGLGPDPVTYSRYEEEDMHTIRDLIMNSSIPQYLALADIDPEDWCEQLAIPRDTWYNRNHLCLSNPQDCTWHGNGEKFETSKSIAFLTLLMLLPNLQSLTPCREWNELNVYTKDDYESQYIYPVLDALVKHSHDRHYTGQVLSKLQNIYPSYPQGGEQRAAFRNHQWFLQLPSITSTYVLSCTAMKCTSGPNFNFSWRIPEIPSSLTRLELAYCDMEAEDISLILSNTPRLQVFKYGQKQNWPGVVPPWSAQVFVEAVARSCGSTLKELAVTLHSCGKIEHGVQNFLGFLNLKKLEIDLQILCGPSKESGRALVWVGREHYTSGWQVPDGTCRWEAAELPCLASILPESLERVDININDSWCSGPAVMALLTDFAEERAARLPALEKVLFRQGECDSERDVVEAEECELEVFKLNENLRGSLRSQSWSPLWVKEFEEKFGVKSVYDDL
jgi:hypothetical protein